jgi:hypothetical protein
VTKEMLDANRTIAYAGACGELAMRQWKWILVIAPTGVLVAFIASVFWPQSDRITRANFQRLREGMTAAEVVAILGSSGDYRTEPVIYDILQQSAYFQPLIDADDFTIRHCYWCNDTSEIIVSFNRSFNVERFGWVNAVGSNSSSFETFRWRVNRQWYKCTGQTGCVKRPLL